MTAPITRSRPCGRRLPVRAAALLVLLIATAQLTGLDAAFADDLSFRRHSKRRHPRHPRVIHHPHPPGPDDRDYFVQLKLGGFDPEGPKNDGGLFGFSTGIEFQNRITAGFTLDYYRRSLTDEVIIAEAVDENGNVITTSARRLETSSNLIPLGMAISLRLPGSRTVTPFVGAGVAYEILVNEVHNYEQGIEDTNVFHGPGWQLFGGLMVPVTSDVRLLGEVWTNDATVRRDIDRYVMGLPVTERIDVDGFGGRLGIEFRFD
jgi:hypothetical protein